jgi:Protein of unknown function (DUF3551)
MIDIGLERPRRVDPGANSADHRLPVGFQVILVQVLYDTRDSTSCCVVIMRSTVVPRSRKMIHFFILIVALFIGIAVGSLGSAIAQVSQYPFCIQGADNPGWTGCSFNTLQACQAAASGTEAECLSNPWYRAGANAPTPSTPYGAPMGANDPLPVGPPPE